MRARLAFAVSMAVDFDCFLIDEITAVGDTRFHAKCQDELFEKRKDRAFIIVSHEMRKLRAQCQRFCVLNKGKLFEFPEFGGAFRYYNINCR